MRVEDSEKLFFALLQLSCLCFCACLVVCALVSVRSSFLSNTHTHEFLFVREPKEPKAKKKQKKKENLRRSFYPHLLPLSSSLSPPLSHSLFTEQTTIERLLFDPLSFLPHIVCISVLPPSLPPPPVFPSFSFTHTHIHILCPLSFVVSS